MSPDRAWVESRRIMGFAVHDCQVTTDDADDTDSNRSDLRESVSSVSSVVRPGYDARMSGRKMTWWIVAGGWSVVTLVYSVHLYVFHNLMMDPTTWVFQLGEAFADFV